MNDDLTEKERKLRILKTRMLKLRKLEAELRDHNETLFRKVRNTLIAVEREMLKIDPEQVIIPTIHISEETVNNHHELF
jgi:hypothetical protein